MRQRGIAPGARLVLIWLAEHANGKTGRCDPSVAMLEEETGFSADAIARHVRALEEAGLVTAERIVGLRTRYILRHADAENPPQNAGAHPPQNAGSHERHEPRHPPQNAATPPAKCGEDPPQNAARTKEVNQGRNQGSISNPTVAPSPSQSHRARARDEPPRNVIAFPKADPPATEGSLFGEPAVPALASPSSAEAFEASWAAYGRKGSKAEARREWDAAVKRLRAERPARGPSDIRRALDERLPFMAEEFKYRPDFCRWLKRSLFDEDVEAMARRRNSRPITPAEEMLHDLGMTAAEIDAMCNPPRRTTHGD